MSCNLNFNQCNSGRQYPADICTVRCNLLSGINSSQNTIVNPSPNISFLASNITPQTVAVGGSVIPTVTLTRGNSITFDGTNAFVLAEGRYLVTYAASGVIPSGNTFAFALYQNESQIPTSVSSITGIPGNSATAGDSEIISVTGSAISVSLRNIGSGPTALTSGSIILQRL